jgi:hypothetical protein
LTDVTTRWDHLPYPKTPSLASNASTDYCTGRPRHKSTRSLSQHIPIQRLPSELLVLIIQTSSTQDTMAPYIASQVCRKWRRILLRTPILWSTVFLDHRIVMWNHWIRRSKQCLLDVYLHEPAQDDRRQTWNHDLVRWILQPALPHVRRWRGFDVQLSTPAPFLWNSVLSPLCGTTTQNVAAPALRKLVLSYPANEDEKQFAVFGGHTPNLRSITMDSVRLACSSVFQHVTLLRYTYRHTSGNQDMSNLVSTLRACVSLQHLRLIFDVRHRTSTISSICEDPIVHLSQLLHLELAIVGQEAPPDLADFFNRVQFPGLQTLRCTHRMFSHLRAFSATETYTSNLGPLYHLKELEVEDGWVDRRFILGIVAKAQQTVGVHIVLRHRRLARMAVPHDAAHCDRRWLDRWGILWPKHS